ncbi:unnamed protein product [Brachionus calyciflorus]|uniref:Uncharacterized protein n=1 Tax=Brachionus calyciflorus TaxID=104777 RepID=A0A813RGH4_9BILA|nr:unnamed protein product [Brachionus calyciflorus]
MANSMSAPSVFNLETNVELWLARFDSYLEINRIFADRDWMTLRFSLWIFAAVLNDLGRRAFPDLTPRELDAYIRGQFMTVLRNRDKADKFAKMDIGDMETLVLRAGEQEILFLGFSGFGIVHKTNYQIEEQ